MKIKKALTIITGLAGFILCGCTAESTDAMIILSLVTIADWIAFGYLANHTFTTK